MKERENQSLMAKYLSTVQKLDRKNEEIRRIKKEAEPTRILIAELRTELENKDKDWKVYVDEIDRSHAFLKSKYESLTEYSQKLKS